VLPGALPFSPPLPKGISKNGPRTTRLIYLNRNDFEEEAPGEEMAGLQSTLYASPGLLYSPVSI